jgi:flagellar hook-basal body complex protein FliE
MSTTILPIRSPVLPAIESLPSVNPAPSAPANSFADLLSNSVNTVESATNTATQAAQQFLSGENEDLHTVAIAEQKAELTTELFLQVRSKAISAYQEIMRMQL